MYVYTQKRASIVLVCACVCVLVTCVLLLLLSTLRLLSTTVDDTWHE